MNTQRQNIIDLYNKLFIAIQNNNILEVKTILATDIDINLGLKPIYGMHHHISSLHFAIKNRACENIIKALLEHGADFNIQDNDGETPLHYAVRYNQANIAEILIKKGAEVDIRDNKNYTPLHLCTYIACLNNTNEVFDYYDTIDTLLKYGANPNLTLQYNEYTPFTIGLNYNIYKAFKLFHHYRAYLVENADKNKLALLYHGAIRTHLLGIEEVKSLLAMGIPINNTKPKDILWYAFEYGDADIVKLLLDNGASCNNILGVHKRSYLHLASMLGYNEIVKILLSRGLDINAKDTLGATALHYATNNNHVETVTTLLNNDAKTNITDNTKSHMYMAFLGLYKTIDGSIAVDTSNKNNHIKAAQIIKNHISTPKSLLRLSRLAIRNCIKANKKNINMQQAIYNEAVLIPRSLKNYVYNIFL